MFDVHFALLGTENVIVPFGIDKAREAISFCEPVHEPVAMLPNASGEVGCRADIQRAAGPISHDVDPATWHDSLP